MKKNLIFSLTAIVCLSVTLNSYGKKRPKTATSPLSDSLAKGTLKSEIVGSGYAWDINSTGNIYYNGQSVTVGYPAYTGAKFNVKGSQYTTHFYHGANQDVYLRPGMSTGRIIMDIGNVGIGLPNPSYKLHVVAPANTWKARFSGSDGYIDIGPANSGWAHIYTDRPAFIFNKPVYSIGGIFSSYSTDNLYLQTGGTTRMTLTTGGKVGIGCDNPSADLEIYKYDYSDWARLKLRRFSGDIADAWEIRAAGALTFWHAWAGTPNNNPTSFTQKFVFGNDGHFLATQITASSKITTEEFEVKELSSNTIKTDSIKANDLMLKVNNVADYVFNEDYNLPPLAEVERFVKENRHLPGLPEGKQLEENGMNVAEMNNLLLQKMEELMLYTIQQQKLIEELKGKINRLENKQ